MAPDHRMVPVTIGAQATDNCGAVTCEIIGVASSESANGTGDGNTSPDWVITGALTVNLRAERSGPGDGRVYAITARCTDAFGNSATNTISVTVPHDQAKE